MHVLVDYRPALRERTGVGEYIHELVRALARQRSCQVSAFVSSWKDRPPPQVSAEPGVRVVDRRVPTRLLNFLWHRVGWPPVERLAGPADLVHAAHPLLIPARDAAQVVTIHDLFFLTDPTVGVREIRRDYASLAEGHARRAHAVVTSSQYGRAQVVDTFGVPPERVYVIPPGAPRWERIGRQARGRGPGHALFVGTLEPRKNIGTLLDAWEAVIGSVPEVPPLVLAGRAGPQAGAWLARLARPPLAGRVRHVGYVHADEREALYADARLLVLPSLEEGFGLPALEAMSAGVPVVATTRGALPEVTAGAALLVEPTDTDALANALRRVLGDNALASSLAQRGLDRARAFDWDVSAQALLAAYRDAIDRRAREGRAA